MDQNSLILREVVTVHSGAPRTPHFAGETRIHQDDAGAAPAGASYKRKKRLALVLGLSGTIFSAVGFLALTLFELYNDSLNELNRDLKHFNEASADLVKKDSLLRMREHLRDIHKTLEADAATRILLERELQTSLRERQEMARELQRLRERLASVEGRQAATPIIVPVPKSEGSTPAPGFHLP